MHMEWPAVHCLPVHLPGQHMVAFRPNVQLNNVVENVKDTALLGWFKANQDPDLIAAGAHVYFYQEFPKKFIWHKGQAVWKLR